MSDSDLTVAEARARAYRLLGNREHSRQELTGKLISKGVPDDIAAIAVDELASEGLVSDRRFAESFVRSRVNRFQGPLKIRAELKQRGVPLELIEDALSAHEDQWIELAAQWVHRHARTPMDRQERARMYRNGGSRGFSHEQMMAALDRARDH